MTGKLRSIEALMPSDTPAYMLPAWIGCINFASTQPDIVEAFRTETGNNWTPGKSGLERMIDKATGADWEFVKAFVLWANTNVWGPIDGSEGEP